AAGEVDCPVCVRQLDLDVFGDLLEIERRFLLADACAQVRLPTGQVTDRHLKGQADIPILVEAGEEAIPRGGDLRIVPGDTIARTQVERPELVVAGRRRREFGNTLRLDGLPVVRAMGEGEFPRLLEGQREL